MELGPRLQTRICRPVEFQAKQFDPSHLSEEKKESELPHKHTPCICSVQSLPSSFHSASQRAFLSHAWILSLNMNELPEFSSLVG